jgi:hypothetical protein
MEQSSALVISIESRQSTAIIEQSSMERSTADQQGAMPANKTFVPFANHCAIITQQALSRFLISVQSSRSNHCAIIIVQSSYSRAATGAMPATKTTQQI